MKKTSKKTTSKKQVTKKKSKPKTKKYEHSHPTNSTEHSLTKDLSEDLRDAWVKIRAFAASVGVQRIYASGWAIMFAKKNCYFFVRPKKSYLETCLFLPRSIEHPLVKRSTPSSKTKFAVMCNIVHADQVEEPFTDWIREAYSAMPEV
ncbi:MAG: DUF5655 domain-containing protein [Bdellovibrionota bacterium]